MALLVSDDLRDSRVKLAIELSALCFRLNVFRYAADFHRTWQRVDGAEYVWRLFQSIAADTEKELRIGCNSCDGEDD